ncbi:MAG: hypothetical protein ACE5F4_02320 [Candidatus Paceibacteria bacterium]
MNERFDQWQAKKGHAFAARVGGGAVVGAGVGFATGTAMERAFESLDFDASGTGILVGALLGILLGYIPYRRKSKQLLREYLEGE